MEQVQGDKPPETPLKKKRVFFMMKPKKRTKSIKIRLSDSEHKELLALAQNKPLAEFMREYCLSADSEYFAKVAKANREKINRLTVPPELLRQLASVGNNVNQISRNLNKYQSQGDHINLMKLAIILQNIESELIAIRVAYAS